MTEFSRHFEQLTHALEEHDSEAILEFFSSAQAFKAQQISHKDTQ